MRGIHPAHGSTLVSRPQLHGVTGLVNFDGTNSVAINRCNRDGIQLLPQDSNSTTTSLRTAVFIQSLVTSPEAIITTAQFL